MTRFIPREKLGKKARRRQDSERRALWPVPPVTRKIESARLYNRKKRAHARAYSEDMSSFFRQARFNLPAPSAAPSITRSTHTMLAPVGRFA